MPVELDNAVALSKALKNYAPDLAKETQKEIAGHLRKVVNQARGFVPAQSPLSGWGNQTGIWEYRAFNAGLMKRGIGYSTTPTKPNKRGFRSLATIFNKSAAGAIYEQAGVKNPQGQPWVGPKGAKGHRFSHSSNPRAGEQFINNLPPIVSSLKGRGRLIYRSWAESKGLAEGAAMRAIDKATTTFMARSKTPTFRKAA